MYFAFPAGRERQVGHRFLRRGDVIGCLLDLNIPEMRFTLNGQTTSGIFRGFNNDGLFFPVMSMSALVR
jgi:ryanodine receptor 2